MKILKKMGPALLIIVISLIAAFTGLLILKTIYSPKVINPFEDITLSVPTDVASTGYFSINKSSIPGYFSSSANIYAFTYSPYADIFNFTLELSTDNSSWIKVPFIKSQSQPQDYNQFANLGNFMIDKPTEIPVYGRYVVPPQNVTLPPDVTPYIILESVKGQIIIKQQETPHDQMLEVLVFITLFSLSLSIIRLLRDEWNKKENR